MELGRIVLWVIIARQHAERDIVMANPSVRPSVRHRLWYCTNEHIVKLFPPSGSGMTGFLSATTITK